MGINIRNEVLILVPPNSNTVMATSPLTVTRPEELSDWSAFASLGPLGLASALRDLPDLRPTYLDGTVVSLNQVRDYLSERAPRLLAVCVSALTANYEAGLALLKYAKDCDPAIVTVIGGHHVSALPREVLRHAQCVDVGFAGNDVVGPFRALIADLRAGREGIGQPGLITRRAGEIHVAAAAPEEVFTDYDYRLLDGDIHHTALYQRNFQERIAPRYAQLFGRAVGRGIPLDIGRGCVKFANDDACSFCSIHQGSQWRKQLTPAAAWRAITRARQAGYDYLYVTADELPLTFYGLLSGMRDTMPPDWSARPDDERPVLVGYARADGLGDPKRVRLLRDLGFRQLMVGMDGGSAVSLAALRKPRNSRATDLMRRAERLYRDNWRAVRVARDNGLALRAGFVVGHIGMTSALLQESTQRAVALLAEGRDVFSAMDVEVLLPEPGSLDFQYLTQPDRAARAAGELGLHIDRGESLRVAHRWRGRDVAPPELSTRDYVRALMPDVTFEALAAARNAIREGAKALGIVIGEA